MTSKVVYFVLEVKSSSNDDVTGDDDNDDDYYYTDDGTDKTDEEYEVDDDYEQAKSRPESRSYYPEPDHYPEQEYHEPQYYYQPTYQRKKKKKVYVPVFVPEKEKKKSEFKICHSFGLTLYTQLLIGGFRWGSTAFPFWNPNLIKGIRTFSFLPTDAFHVLQIMSKFFLRSGLHPNPAEGAYSAPQTP